MIYVVFVLLSLVIIVTILYSNKEKKPVIPSFKYFESQSTQAKPIYGTSGSGGAPNCILQNNLTFNTNATAHWTLNGNINVDGNVLTQDPQMASQTAVNSGADNPLPDFTIAAGSVQQQSHHW